MTSGGRFQLLLAVAVSGLACAIASDQSAVPVGHLQRLGSHRPREGATVELVDVPHPIEFYERYAKPQVPVILRGAAKTMPAYKRWTDAYLKDKSGDEEVSVEPGKKENRTRVAIEGHQAPFGEFLDIYNKSDIYMVDSIPKPLERKPTLKQIRANCQCTDYVLFEHVTKSDPYVHTAFLS